jgi:hypothetical protein
MEELAPERYSERNLWRDNFSEMADSLHEYIVSALQGTGKDFSYEALNTQRPEVEEGYSYFLEGTFFDFSLAGTVNEDPEILEDSSRRAVFQVQEIGAWPTIRKALEDKVDTEIEEKKVGPQTVYELVVESPYTSEAN